jgi:alkylhydroperoxidase family enzyme
MPWIKETYLEEASGLLKRQLNAAIKRAGRIWNIVQVMSINEMTLKDSIKFYQTVMMGESPLTRSQREMLAVVVSVVNNCHY